jgi:hypothetical protein
MSDTSETGRVVHTSPRTIREEDPDPRPNSLATFAAARIRVSSPARDSSSTI